MSDQGYVNYFEVLDLTEDAKPGEIRKSYRHLMKDLVMEIRRVEITEERRSRYLLDMAKLNAAFYILRNKDTRDQYWNERQEVMALEEEWRAAAAQEDAAKTDGLRRRFERKLRDFLARYVEEAMLEAGRDKDCVEESHWDAAHERHASRILRFYRQKAYQQIRERLPYWDITLPRIDWDERQHAAARLLDGAPGRARLLGGASPLQ
ncbi:MAG TPA: hypothetical protein PLO37_10440, partial [Candidatus Hydrogenedentes bacterium]|nr:hypothetical protein [Candidatus Hydrogenedentota bacterium]HPG67253.1 hypothetical protein [Candidatus Hydrogenedentota bacterium]